MDAFIGEIRAFGFNYYPDGWLPCDGRSIQVSQFQALYAVIGTVYGGSGTTFKLPDLRGKTALGQDGSDTNILGEAGGSEFVTLSANQLPQHTHLINAFSPAADQRSSLTNQPGTATYLSEGYSKGITKNVQAYSANKDANIYLNDATLGNSQTGGQPHENRMPFLVMNYCICYDGEFPPRP